MKYVFLQVWLDREKHALQKPTSAPQLRQNKPKPKPIEPLEIEAEEDYNPQTPFLSSARERRYD